MQPGDGEQHGPAHLTHMRPGLRLRPRCHFVVCFLGTQGLHPSTGQVMQVRRMRLGVACALFSCRAVSSTPRLQWHSVRSRSFLVRLVCGLHNLHDRAALLVVLTNARLQRTMRNSFHHERVHRYHCHCQRSPAQGRMLIAAASPLSLSGATLGPLLRLLRLPCVMCSVWLRRYKTKTKTPHWDLNLTGPVILHSSDQILRRAQRTRTFVSALPAGLVQLVWYECRARAVTDRRAGCDGCSASAWRWDDYCRPRSHATFFTIIQSFSRVSPVQ